MLRSMTAFGRSDRISPLGHFYVEIQSVNRKFLEFNSSVPFEFLRFESEIKRWIAQEVSRGQIYIKLSVSYENKMPVVVKPNIPLARQIALACQEIGEALQLESVEELTTRLLSSTKEILHYDEQRDEEKAYLEIIRTCCTDALEQLLKMKQVEGDSLAQDILMRIEKISKTMDEVAAHAPEVVKKQQQKLKERMEEVLPGRFENEERILREICLYADRVDISEEITRFRSHVTQVVSVIKSSEKSVGKNLEFLLQELGREINTIGSKAAHLGISHLVVEVKVELERIREQIQNIE